MSVETVYIPHHTGAVLGRQYQRPWIASTAALVSGAPWQGQPALTDTAARACQQLSFVDQRVGESPSSPIVLAAPLERRR